MSDSALKRSEEFLKIADQFKLGALLTESSHPVTANLSKVAKQNTAEALKLLFRVDDDVIRKYREFAQTGRALEIAETLINVLESGGKIFFTGCGSTGRLSIQLVSIWRGFWQDRRQAVPHEAELADSMENRAFSVMAGGDFALIKAVEGFEDFTEFGKKQIGDLGIARGDVVFAITEGGETSFVIGTAWKGVEVGAKVYFVYNNPDDVLIEHVERSRQVILDPRIEKINLTTGPMAITGSTRMQATTIQLCVLLTVLEIVVRKLTGQLDPNSVTSEFATALAEMHSTLLTERVLSQLAGLVGLEESVYRKGKKNNYFADRFGIDVLTDTTERSPTFCTPPFRRFDDTTAAESWAFLYVPYPDSETAWRHILKREPQCVEWSEEEVRALVGDEKAERQYEIIKRIGVRDLMCFRVGLNGIPDRPLGPGDSAVAIVDESERESLLCEGGFFRTQLEAARKAGAGRGLIYFGTSESVSEVGAFCSDWDPECKAVIVPVPKTSLLLDGVTRVGVKMLLNALSTCTMVRLGRVMGNYMVWVVPSNLKLIDRSTRYISRLTGLSYEEANRLLFESIEYIEPRWKADQAYPPVVGLSVIRHRYNLSCEEAEKRLWQEIGL
ncbi:MAG: hypothetical protein QHI38_07850 [Armatimonadota bacterium]|nr:hypothetical protein [Armatimonadota bacterium]